jgi:hypothetical protein
MPCAMTCYTWMGTNMCMRYACLNLIIQLLITCNFHFLKIFEISNFVSSFLKVQNKDGSTERKEVILEEQDPIWVELRHTHIGDVSYQI